MGFAAEEIGLIGSGEIAQMFANEHKTVAGMLNLDMTNYKGSVDNRERPSQLVELEKN